MPYAGETAVVRIAGRRALRRGRAIKRDGCTTCISRCCRRETDILQAVRCSEVIHVDPVIAMVIGPGDACLRSVMGKCEVNAAGAVDRDGGIISLPNARRTGSIGAGVDLLDGP